MKLPMQTEVLSKDKIMKFKVGDKVKYGEAIGRVVNVHPESYGTCPVVVNFRLEQEFCFTMEGHLFLNSPHGFPRLELIEEKIIP